MRDNELMHYGVPGMRWGHRKARPMSAERGRYKAAKAEMKTARKEYNKAYKKAYNYSSAHPISQFTRKKGKTESDKRWHEAYDKAQASNKANDKYAKAKAEYKKTDEYKQRRATAIKAGAAVAGTALAAYGAYKLNKYIRTKNGEIAAERGYKAAMDAFRMEEERAVESINRAINRGATDAYSQARVHVGDYSKRYAEYAKNDSLARATRNVVDYRKQHGKGSLRNLVSLESAVNRGDIYSEFRKPKK